MKKVALLLLGLSLSTFTFAQVDSCKKCETKHLGIANGKTPYISGSFLSSSVPFSYSAEAGLWGTTSNTSFGVVADFLRDGTNTTHFLGIKWYQTFYQNKTSCYMVYLAPKANLDYSKSSPVQSLLEVGINPNYEINKHMLMSVSFCDQIYNDANNFNKSIWHPGISVGVVIFK